MKRMNATNRSSRELGDDRWGVRTVRARMFLLFLSMVSEGGLLRREVDSAADFYKIAT